MSAELINTLLILGAGQGLFLAIVLATRRTNSAANRILAVAMVAFSVLILMSLYYTREVYLEFPHFIGASVSLIYLFGPILYVYAQAVSAGGHHVRKTAWLHFIPFILVTLYYLPFYFQGGAAKLAFLRRLFQEGPPLDLSIIQQLQIPHGILYTVLTFGVLRRHRARLRENYSSIERINLLWLRNLTIGIALVWGLVTALHLLMLADMEVELESSLIALAVSFLVYGIGYMGLRQPEIFGPVGGMAAVPGKAEAGGTTAEAAGYEKSGLTPALAEARLQQLLQVMEERKLYRQSLLTLQDLAQETSISPHNLSEVLNTQLGKNFYDFVNQYRIEEAMRRLIDPRSAHFTILAIAEESGFNSKSTFNATFRRHTGLTPSQYRAAHRTPDSPPFPGGA